MAGEDRQYTDWIAKQPCASCGIRFRSQVHHRTGAGMGLRAHDHDSMPMCSGCHRDFHDLIGAFKTWDKALRGDWQDLQTEVHFRKYALMKRVPSENVKPPEDTF